MAVTPINLDSGVQLGTWGIGGAAAVGPTAAGFTVGTVAAQLPTSAATQGVMVKADAANTGKIRVGSSSSVSNSPGNANAGVELSGGESITFQVNNANLIWVVADTAGQTGTWAVV